MHGLLGLLREEDRERIPLDYGMEPMAVFQKVSDILWREHREEMLGDLLPALEFRPSERDYPSWVPDFAAQTIRGWKDYRSLQASEPLVWAGEEAPALDHGLDPLVLQGIMVDVVKTAITTPVEFEDIEDLVPVLATAEKTMLGALSVDLPLNHRLKPFEDARREERVFHVLTRSAVEWTEPFFPGLDDETVWDALLGRDTLPFLALDSQQLLRLTPRKMLFRRLARMLRAKFLDRRVLITEAGFVGVGVRQIEEDVVVFHLMLIHPLFLGRVGISGSLLGAPTSLV